MADGYDTVIVGAGHGGAHLALSLRQRRYPGTIGLLSDENCLPYERPPLSKECLAGTRSLDGILIRSAGAWAAQRIDLNSGSPVVTVDAASREVGLQSGQSFKYGNLVWAAGGRARMLSCAGAGLEGVHSIRTCADVVRLRSDLQSASRVVVVGGGYIGLESAATISKLCKHVTILEATPQLLARVSGPEIAHFFQREHAQQGVVVELDAKVIAIDGSAGRVTGVHLADGRRITADLVIVGIGIQPRVEALAAAGARTSNGVSVDHQCRTSLPDVFAVGDCALHANRFAASGVVRLESVQNATEQAATVARVLTGESAVYDSVPWFWSQQYDLKLLTVGLSDGHDAAVVRGRPADRSFSVVYTRRGKVIALDCVNAPRDFVQGKQLVSFGATPDPEALAESSIDLKSLLA